MKSLFEAIEAVGAAEVALEDAKAQVAVKACAAIEDLGTAAIRMLYWSESLPPGVIARSAGIGTHEVWKVAGPRNVGQCACGGPIEARSLSQFHSFRSRVCEDCLRDEYERRRNAISVDWHALNKEREARDERRNQLRWMPYRQYLRTEEWRERRMQALQRAGFRCQTCNAGGRLEVHHRTYERRGAEEMSDLTVLCRGCHQNFHDNRELA
jgi:5-methylcytosine-specific restriction endonuclease McrA